MTILSNPYLEMHIVSSLEKVFPDETPTLWNPTEPVYVLSGERFCFQVALFWDNIRHTECKVNIESEIDGIKWRTVELVPCGLAAYPEHDMHYIRTQPGLFPDLLQTSKTGNFWLYPQQWRALWIDIPSDAPSGEHTVTVRILGLTGNEMASKTIKIKRLKAELPPQTLYYTQWLHADCLANYYKVPAFSEEHWQILENFVKKAVELGVDVLFTPLVTPPLDTQVGGERTTVQLLDISLDNGKYKFGFDKLERWIKMGKRCGVRLFEMNHLFTQWGALHCPKIIVNVDGVEKRFFGWEEDAAGDNYREFLDAMLPAVAEKLREWGIDKQTIFHISDEPGKAHLEQYKRLKAIVEPHLKGFYIMDALSVLDYYEQGVVEHPVCATNKIEPFLEAKVPDLWTYYCCSQSVDVSNRFFAMSSARNRIIGLQMYKYDIAGFLHWGYNFYSTGLSVYPIDPYRMTDCDGAFPSGDAFSVYPGEDGNPEESLRAVVFLEALQDMRALKLLEQLTSKEEVMALVESGLSTPLTFKAYPHNPSYILNVRERVNKKIAELTDEK